MSVTVTEGEDAAAAVAAAPETFRQAVETLTAAPVRREVRVEPLRPPQRLAPYSYAVSAEIIDADGKDLATGRLVLLHDPDGHEAWQGRPATPDPGAPLNRAVRRAEAPPGSSSRRDCTLSVPRRVTAATIPRNSPFAGRLMLTYHRSAVR